MSEVLNNLKAVFAARFADRKHGGFVLASAPGRVELAGNHTDHQGGLVISGAIDLRAWGLAAPNGTDEIRLIMEGFGEARLDLSAPNALDPHEDEFGTSLAIARGMAAEFAKAGGEPRGFDMVTRSDIPAGCGVSSSAAFEMLIGCTLREMFDTDDLWQDSVTLALAGMRAERAFFGKPCGAQDQIASACGNAVAMDFSCEPPHVQRLDFDANACGHALCLIDSHCDHSLYTDEFAAIPQEMREAARHFGCETLGEVNPTDFLMRLDDVRTQLSDRHALRALHFFAETSRVAHQRVALESDAFEDFLTQVRLSGASSAQFLQSVSPEADRLEPKGQPAMVILALCAQLLGARGAWRIHGGGFGGSVLAFVPEQEATQFTCSMNACLGYAACRLLRISSEGAWARKVD